MRKKEPSEMVEDSAEVVVGSNESIGYKISRVGFYVFMFIGFVILMILVAYIDSDDSHNVPREQNGATGGTAQKNGDSILTKCSKGSFTDKEFEEKGCVDIVLTNCNKEEITDFGEMCVKTINKFCIPEYEKIYHYNKCEKLIDKVARHNHEM